MPVPCSLSSERPFRNFRTSQTMRTRRIQQIGTSTPTKMAVWLEVGECVTKIVGAGDGDVAEVDVTELELGRVVKVEEVMVEEPTEEGGMATLHRRSVSTTRLGKASKNLHGCDCTGAFCYNTCIGRSVGERRALLWCDHDVNGG